MSAILIALRRDRIVVLVDSKAAGCAGMAKLWPIVHIPAVICGRGPVGFLVDIAQRTAAMADSFDQLIELLPTALDAALRTNASNMAWLAGRDQRLEVYVAGISPSTSRSTVCSFVFTDSGVSAERYEQTSETGDYLVAAPWVAEKLGPFPEVPSGLSDTEVHALLRDVHRRQIELLNSQWGASSAGGRRITAIVTERSVTSEITGE